MVSSTFRPDTVELDNVGCPLYVCDSVQLCGFCERCIVPDVVFVPIYKNKPSRQKTCFKCIGQQFIYQYTQIDVGVLFISFFIDDLYTC